MKQTRFLIFFCLISMLSSCEKDIQEDVIFQEQHKNINIRTISSDNFSSNLKELGIKESLESVLTSSETELYQARPSDPRIEILNDIIKETTSGDYRSYTMYLRTPDTNENNFYNVTLEENQGILSMFMTKYEATENWIRNENQQFEGVIFTKRISGNIYEPAELAYLLTKVFDALLESGNGGSGGNGGSSSTYPLDCDGTVITTTVVTEIKCGCGHDWQDYLSQTCTGCTESLPRFPSLSTSYVYECIPNTTIPPDNGGGNNGGGGSGPSTPGNTSLTTIVGPGIVKKEIIDPCILIKKLKEDILFKQKMNNLLTATNFKFEKVFTVYKNPTPESQPTSIYRFVEYNGTISQPSVKYPFYPEIKGIMHSHYENLLSVFSPQDLEDIYLKLKNTEVTDEFFSALVTKAGTKYVIAITNRTNFIAFGDKYLSDSGKIKYFTEEIYNKKYDININNANNSNEKGFVKMMTELNAGINTFKGNSDFTDWQKLSYSPITNQVTPSGCN